MNDEEMTEPGPNPTAEDLAGTVFENVADYSQANGGGLLTSEAAIGGGDG